MMGALFSTKARSGPADTPRTLSSLVKGDPGIIGLFTATGTGSVPRTNASKLGDVVSAKDKGAVGDGVTNDTAAIQTAIDSFGAAGGTVIVPNGMRCLIDTGLTVRANVHIVGPHQHLGTSGNNTSSPYGTLGGTLIVNPAATITMGGGASLKGLLIHRKGMTFPADDASAFAGTAVTGGGDDVTVRDCMILGFALAYSSSSYQRPTIFNLKFDCLGGVLVDNCADIAYVSECHGWPFVTIASVAGLTGQLKRSGIGFQMTGLGDWNKITNCFTYGYFRGFNINGCSNVTLTGCGADNTPPGSNPYVGAIGFLIDGAANDTRLIGCQTAAQQHGYYINTTAGKRTRLIGCDSWVCSANGVVVVSGDCSINGGMQRDTGNGVLVSLAASNVFVDEIRFDNISSQPVASSVASANIVIGPLNDYGNVVGANGSALVSPTVASASGVTLPHNGSTFNISGTTTIATLSTGWAGRVVALLFINSVTVTHGTAGATSMRLASAANFVAPAGGSLTLRHNGVLWTEVGRCA